MAEKLLLPPDEIREIQAWNSGWKEDFALKMFDKPYDRLNSNDQIFVNDCIQEDNE